MTSTPIPIKKKESTEEPVDGGQQMSFGEALLCAVDGAKVRRLDWGETKHYLQIHGGDDVLVIFNPDYSKFFPFTTRGVDITGTDWVVVEDE